MLSIIIPVLNEEQSVGPLIDAVRGAMRGWRDDWELIFVDDGSRDHTASVVEGLIAGEPRVRLIRLARNYGQSAAMQAGFDHARGDLIITMDGDHQNDPGDIPALVEQLEKGSFDLVAGYREQRQDRLFLRRVPSVVANLILRRITGVPIRDSGCTLKAFRRELLVRLRLYSDLHRFIPALAVSIAGARIAEIPVRHYPRQFGKSKYGISRVSKVLVDLLTLTMLRRFREHPLRMFSVVGIGASALATAALGLALLSSWGRFDRGSVVILVAVAICWLALAGFLFMAGVIAECFLDSEGASEPFESLLLRVVQSRRSRR